ncbi:hypothetical protein PS2_022379 [Malus domestica]
MIDPCFSFWYISSSCVILRFPSSCSYDYYSFSVIPALGELVAGDRESYQYLVESIRRFPPQYKLALMIADAGFQQVEYENLVGGVVAIHSRLKV